jgi:hypothetical protein
LILAVGAAALGGCLLPRDSDRVRQFADAFLTEIREGNAANAWAELAPAARREAFGDDQARFADALDSGIGSLSSWTVRDPTKSDLVWTVRVELTGGATAIPPFLVETRLASEWSEDSQGGPEAVRGLILLVEPIDGHFFVQAGGLANSN